ncbi:MAG: hypothetical protein KF703_17300 [Actinobacteria bacterium]|nr:hypothetical protein [Actinomycetota bacterium]
MSAAAPTEPDRRRAARLVGAVLAVVALGVGATACGTKPPSRQELVDSLVTSGLPKSESTCAADAIYDNLSSDEIAEIVERGGSGAPRDDPQDANDTMDKLRAALGVCRDQAAATSTTVPSSSTTSTTVPGSSTTTTTPP